MASNFDCLGLGSLDRDGMNTLLDRILPMAEIIGTAGGITVRRWTDPSGVRLVIALRGERVVDLLPSFAGVPGAALAEIRRVNDEMLVANVVDDGEQVTMLAAAAEQLSLIGPAARVPDCRAAVIALGVQVTVHADEEAFAESDASVFSAGDGSGPPVRTGGEAFISYGVFDQQNGEPVALLNGVVLSADRRVVGATGGAFSVARVRTAGFEADVCLPGDMPTPVPGNVIAGTVYLITDVPVAKPKRRWWLT